MRTYSIAIVTAAVIAGLVVSSAPGAPPPAGKSQSPGFVRIRDAAPIRNTSVLPANEKTTVSPVHYEYAPHSQGASGNCGCGSSGSCGCELSGNCGCGSSSRHCSLDDLLHLDRLTKHSADHGWGRPIKRPIERVSVMYQRYWPQAWYGQGGGGSGGAKQSFYPAVYMPADTAQMGFYYQTVPFWRPNPAMTPPVPWPGHWHQRECGARPAGHFYSQADLPHRSSNSYPVMPLGDGEQAAPQPKPESQPQVPPSPAKKLNQSAQIFFP